jgi:hypothetical protein
MSWNASNSRILLGKGEISRPYGGHEEIWIDNISVELSAEKLDFVSQYLSIRTERVAAHSSVEIKDTDPLCIKMKFKMSMLPEDKITRIFSSASLSSKGEEAKDEQATMESFLQKVESRVYCMVNDIHMTK